MAVEVGRQAKAPPPGCDNRNNDSELKLLECVSVEGVREHQAALQAIADAERRHPVLRHVGLRRQRGLRRREAARCRLRRHDPGVRLRFLRRQLERADLAAPGDYPVFSVQFTPPIAGTGTGVLVPVDVVIPPGTVANSNTSGCEDGDFLGFPDRRGCPDADGAPASTAKALNAQEAGASAAIMFNEGQPAAKGSSFHRRLSRDQHPGGRHQLRHG